MRFATFAQTRALNWSRLRAEHTCNRKSLILLQGREGIFDIIEDLGGWTDKRTHAACFCSSSYFLDVQTARSIKTCAQLSVGKVLHCLLYLSSVELRNSYATPRLVMQRAVSP